MTDTRKSLKVAVAQPLAVPGDCAENIRRMQPMIESAGRSGADLVLFSECGITGYDLKGLGMDAALPIDHPMLDEVAALAAKANIVVVAGLYEQGDGTLYNTAIAFYPDGRRVVQRKHNVIALELDSGRVARADRARVLFDVGGFTCAILICADSGMPNVFDELAEKGCNLVLIASAGLGNTEWAFHLADLEIPERRAAYLKSAESVCYPAGLVDQCIRLRLAVATSNQAGWNEATGFYQPGHSVAVDSEGRLAAIIPGRMICEHLESAMAVGVLSLPSS